MQNAFSPTLINQHGHYPRGLVRTEIQGGTATKGTPQVLVTDHCEYGSYIKHSNLKTHRWESQTTDTENKHPSEVWKANLGW